MKNTDFQKIKDLLTQPANILITTHTNPDGDAIGSSLALSAYLLKKHHQVTIIVPDPFPDFLTWMPGQENVLIFKQDPERCNSIIEEADMVFCLDFNHLDRLNEAGVLIMKSKAMKILIDHHLFPSSHFDLKISIPDTSSTSELIYDFILASGDHAMLDQSIASCIYAGIVTDTGSFSYSCNYVKTYEIVADLYRLGIDGEHIHRLIYDTYSENRLRLLGYSISEKLVVLPDYHTAYISLSREELDRFDYQVGDTEGVVNYALSMKNINLAALFMDRDGQVKISFRSKGNFSVDELARKYFNGGGHSNASGANCDTSLEETLRIFLDILPGFQKQLKSVY